MQLTIIIVNWNSGSQLKEALDSIRNYHHGLVSAVIVVDNASNDESLEFVNTDLDQAFQLHIIRNDINRGFAAACNQGAKLAKTPYLLFLNPDTRLFADSLSIPVAFMENPAHRDIGICGIRMVDAQGLYSNSASNFPTINVMAGQILGLNKFFSKWFPPHLIPESNMHDSRYVDQIIGAFFLIRLSVFELCGGFDERFFVYFEEVDLSLRAKQLGYASYYLAETSAFHKGGGCSERVKALRLFYYLRSRFLFAQKHYTSLNRLALIFLTSVELPLRILKASMQWSFIDIKNSVNAYYLLFKYFVSSAE